MRKLKFNPYERTAGFFLLFAIGGICLTALSVAVKQGWFESKTHLSTTFESADGIHPGTLVQMAGLRAGSVEKVELLGSKKVRVDFFILGKFKERIRLDSRVQLVRPFIIGERVLDVSVGTDEAAMVAENQEIQSEERIDLMNAMGGKSLSTTLQKLSGVFDNLQGLAEAFLNKERTGTMIRAFDRIDPLMKNLNTMSLEMSHMGRSLNKNDDLQVILSNLAVTTAEINKVLPDLNKQNPELAKDLSVMTQNLAIVSRSLGPAMKEIESDLPQASRRILEALNETVVVLKAMEKSFFFRGNVKEVLEEEASRREPASQKTP